MSFNVKECATKPFLDQKAGTSGLRQKTKVFMQENYAQNFIQAVVNHFTKTKKAKDLSVLVCGDGRFYNNTVIKQALNILVANSIKCIYVPKDGYMATPAASYFLKKHNIDFAIVLSASHNPAGVDGDFGIKINLSSGAPATLEHMEGVYKETKSIASFKTLEPLQDFNITDLNNFSALQTDIVVKDFASSYIDYLETIFNFKEIASYIKESSLKVALDPLNAVTCIYMQELCKRLGISQGNVQNKELKEDFGRYAADPNPKDAKHAYDMMVKDKKFDFACVFDGDGDRAMVLGKGIFVSPVDSVAMLAYFAKQQDYYKDKIYGFARTFATSSALDRVAEYLKVPVYVVPTGWKYFTNLLDNKKITICGEESFGASSFHIREKDGLWVFLFWLDILRTSKKSVASLMEDYFKKFGRSYFLRYDYNKLSTEQADKMLKNLEQNSIKELKSNYKGLEITKVYNASYFDEFDNKEVKNQGLIVEFGKNARVVARKSGTATGAVTLRVYIERYNNTDFNLDLQSYLKDLQLFFEDKADFKNIVASNYKDLDIIG